MKIAFVIPWYGPDIPGGAESECRKTALHLKEAGFQVEILTTCVKDFHSDWSMDFHKEGMEAVEGLPVRRFSVRKRDTRAFDAVNLRLMREDMQRLKAIRAYKPDAGPVSPQDGETYLRETVNSPALCEYIENRRALYDFFVFIPYMFGTTYYGAKAAGDKAVIIPCLHDESYAYMSFYKEMFHKARGVLYLSPAEKRLAEGLYGGSVQGFLLGAGVDTGFASDAARFKKKYSIDCPFILCAGRKDEGKNTPLLVDYFSRFKNDYPQSPLKLVLMGSGRVNVPAPRGSGIIDLGFVSAQDKFDAYSAASILCQPSVNESFSLVVMEAWVAGTPVLVHAGCDVTRDFCLESKGGLFFSNYPEFAECVIYMTNNGDAARRMGLNGREYVKRNFAWDVVTKRLVRALEGWKREDGSAPALVKP